MNGIDGTVGPATGHERLAAAAAVVASAVEADRRLILTVAELYPVAGWRAAGARSAEAWLRGCTLVSPARARRLARTANLAASHPALADAIRDGRVSPGRAETLAGFVTERREPFLGPVVAALVRLSRSTSDDSAWTSALAYWADLADQELAISPARAHRVYVSPSLFGGGHIDAHLSPSAFVNVAAAIDAWIEGPDPASAPHRRSVAERRADALDDLATFALTHDPDQPLDAKPDTREGCDRRPRRVRRRSGARIEVVVDLETLARRRDLGDLAEHGFEGLHRHTLGGWELTTSVVERLLCDSALSTTVLAGRHGILDANPAAEQWSLRQRQTVAARDRRCVFPGCARPSHHCDIHHLRPAGEGGPTTTDNAALVCRHHHRLVHDHGWHLRSDPDRGWIAVDRHGQTWSAPLPGARDP